MAAIKTYDFCKFVNYDFSNDFSLYEIGTQKCPPSYSYGPIVRSHNIFHYIFSGKGTLVIDGKHIDIHAKQGFLIPANTLAFYQAHDKQPWTYEWIHVDGPAASELFAQSGFSIESPVITLANPSRFESILQDLVIHSGKQYYCIGKIYELFDCMTNQTKHSAATPMSTKLQYVKKIINFIQVKYSESIHIDDIAQSCGLNRSYLTRLFKEATGSTIQEYLLHYRMKQACRLLDEDNYAIQYVAYAVGYGDTFTFSKAFKRYSGYAPSEYKRRNTSSS